MSNMAGHTRSHPTQRMAIIRVPPRASTRITSSLYRRKLKE
jgi:hypothetical protein